jgi:hypothetical protein
MNPTARNMFLVADYWNRLGFSFSFPGHFRASKKREGVQESKWSCVHRLENSHFLNVFYVPSHNKKGGFSAGDIATNGENSYLHFFHRFQQVFLVA